MGAVAAWMDAWVGAVRWRMGAGPLRAGRTSSYRARPRRRRRRSLRPDRRPRRPAPGRAP